MTLDTVRIATSDPDREQPYQILGLKDDEYQRIRMILGRRPTSSELAMYSVMWSEHCSYKSSKVHLRQFGEKQPKTDVLLVGIGENAGVVDVGQGYAVTFKIESHNHPSFVEPYQGAATGVGGIVRDILTMGARPIAIMDPLRFGLADAPDTKRVLPGVVAGIGGYGNCLGLPNIGGELVFDDTYAGNPLINALCVGVMRHEDIKLAKASGTGNLVVLFGAKTGGDGIGGASILASESFEATRPSKRPSVQVGDPFAEKVLIECCLDIFAEDLVIGIQDLGAAGLSCATSELASAGAGGMHVVLDRVPLRDPSLAPEEILMSESQERMCAIVEPAKISRFLELCSKWDVTATVIGEVNDSTRLTIEWQNEIIVDVLPRTVAHEGPVYERPFAEPAEQKQLQANEPTSILRPKNGAELRQTVLDLISCPNLADKSWVTDQYDKYVQGNTVLAQPEDSGIVRIDENSGLGVAVSTDANARWCRLDPYEGTRLALAEAYRNVATTGARPLAVTNCLNFGSPEDPAVMWQFERAVTGLADACLELGLPVTGGNVSFYNQTGKVAILPTPVVGVLGVITDVAERTPMALVKEGLALYLLGETRDDFAGSEWANIHGHLGGMPPRADLDHERRLAQVLIDASTKNLISAAHDLSDGGLAISLAEMSLRKMVGASISLDGDQFVALFSETPGRVVVAVENSTREEFLALASSEGISVAYLGVTGGPALVVAGQFEIPLDELAAAHRNTFPRLFAGTRDR
jgi:phosphoribosylformylglycinamidine synthase II